MCRRTTLVCLCAAIIFSLTASASGQRDDVVTIERATSELIIRGIKPGGVVAVLAVGRDESQDWPRIVRKHEELEDSDRDGIVRYAIPDLPPAAVIIAVDQSNARFATFPHIAANDNAHENVVTRDDQGRPVSIDASSSQTQALLVRPGVGVWVLRVSEGGRNDADGARNDRVTLAFDRMHRKNGANGPAHLLPQDLLVLVDISSLRVNVIDGDGGGR